MKTKLFILFSLLCVTYVNAQKVINNPDFSSTTARNFIVEQIELTDAKTVLHFKIKLSSDSQFWIASTAHIKSGNSVFPAISIDGLDLDTKVHTVSGESKFSMTFAPIDTTEISQIDFIEGNCDGCFKIFGIKLESGSSSGQNSKKEKQEKEESSVVYNGSSVKVNFLWKKDKKNYDPHWDGFGFAFQDLRGLPDNISLSSGASYSITFNPIETYIPLFRNFLLVSGVGIDWTRYHFKGNWGLVDEGATTKFEPALDGINYTASKLLTYYFTIPLMFEYQVNKFNISAGGIAYFKCYSKSEVEFDDKRGNEIEEELGRDLNLLPVSARLIAQVGTDNVNIFATYSPTSLFKKDQGPDMRPIGAGVRVKF